MTEIVIRLEDLINNAIKYISKSSEEEMSKKSLPEKWSKKEILGHLIDSGINNLQRFTEIQFSDKPYVMRKYNQNELVIANDYQNAESKEILDFWAALNRRIQSLIKKQTDESLAYEIKYEGEILNLEFLMKDYVDHLEHHLNQIKE